MRFGLTILATLLLSSNLNSAELPQLPYSRRLLSATSQLLDKAETKVTVPQSGEGKGTALVIFWTSERGTVVSARGLDGSPELQKVAVDAIYKWKFKPTSLNGRPVQMGSAAMVDFSQSPAVVQAPKPMTAEQLSPGFQFNASMDWSMMSLLLSERVNSNWKPSCAIRTAQLRTDSQFMTNTVSF